MRTIVEDTILVHRYPHVVARQMLRDTLGACPTCGHARKVGYKLVAESIGISRFVLRRFVMGGDIRSSNYFKIIRWLGGMN